MSTVQYECTILDRSKKQGKLLPNEKGYYTLPLGALDCFNSRNEFYASERAKRLFDSSSHFIRRMKDAVLKSEYGHPKRDPKWSDDEYMDRMSTVHEPMVCAHIRRVWLDFSSMRDESGRPVVLIMGEVIPSGPYGQYLKEALDNPEENVCFSVRGYTENRVVNGVTIRDLAEILTWDMVTEPGLYPAKKFYSPVLESFQVTKEMVQKVYDKPVGRLATESSTIQSDYLASRFGVEKASQNRANFTSW